jgi:hypothetical protein
MAAGPPSAQATVVRPEAVMSVDLRPQQELLRETSKLEAPPEQGSLALLALENRGTALAIWQLAEEKLLMEETARLWAAAQPLLVTDLVLGRATHHLAQARHPVSRAKPQDLRRHRAKGSPVRPAHAHRYSQYPGPFAPSQEKQVVRKCNRAARFGDLPTFARYHLPRRRHAPAGCDNRCNRLPHKRADRVRPFPIAASDRYLCLPRQIED